MLHQLRLVPPSTPMGRRPTPRAVVSLRGSLYALAVEAHLDAECEARGWVFEDRARPTPRGSLATREECEYCRPGSGYHVPAGGCPCTKSSRDEYAEMRTAALVHGITHHDGGRIIGIR
jgi:hypothetical protein